jgi:amino acid adenylation domain-containing protein
MRYLNIDVARAIKDTARREKVTPSTIFLAAYAALLFRYTKQSDFIIGTPVSGRPLPELEGLIGFFLNMIPLRVQPDGLMSFHQLIAHVRQVTADGYSNADLPFEKIVQAVQPERSHNSHPLYRVLFVFQNTPTETLCIPGVEVEALQIAPSAVKNDLHLDVEELPDGVRIELSFSSGLFDQRSMERFLSHWEQLLLRALDCPDLPISRLPLLNENERHQILFGWNETQRRFSEEKCVHEFFESQVESRPAALAVIGSYSLTYRELNEQANALADELIRAGAGPETLVGVYLDRSPAMVVALVGILKAGAGYVPLDVKNPAARVEQMIRRLRLQYMVTEACLLSRMITIEPALACRCVVLDDVHDEMSNLAKGTRMSDAHALRQRSLKNTGRRATPHNIAYVIFTSGSTGTPKGVVLDHKAIVNLIEWVQDAFGVNASDKVLCVASLSFDLSVFDIFGLLAVGGTIRLADDTEVTEPATLAHILSTEGITLWNSAPAALEQVSAFLPEAPGGDVCVRLVFLSGDWIRVGFPSELRRKLSGARVVALGGATEAAVWSNCCDTHSIDLARPSIPYGRPMQNAAYYVLDEHLEPCPVGVRGDLYIAGVCLARAYANDPQLTATRFVPNPFQTNSRMYRTGDLARFLHDGTIEFLGRADDQVKIRGFRVELGEIQSLLDAYPGVRQSVVMAVVGPAGDKSLVAWVACQDAKPATTDLQLYLRERLPAYMIPSQIVLLDSLPASDNGKLDRNRLPLPARASMDGLIVESPSRTQIQEIIAGLWEDILGVVSCPNDGDFFEMGGHSILATRLILRIRDLLQVDLPVNTVFLSSTLSAFTLAVENALTNGAARHPITISSPSALPLFPLSFGQQGLWYMDRLRSDTEAYNMPGRLLLCGKLSVKALVNSLRSIVARQSILRTAFVIQDLQPVQLVHQSVPLAVQVVDLSSLRQKFRDQAVAAIASNEARHPFRLDVAPLLRCVLIRLNHDEHTLIINVHHIVGDGDSIQIFARELQAFYSEVINGTTAALPELPFQYGEFALWQRAAVQSGELASQFEYWRKALARPHPLPPLSTSPQGSDSVCRASQISFKFDTLMASELSQLCRAERVTPFMVFLAGYTTLLHAFTGEVDLFIGTPFNNRTRPEFHQLIGLLVNTLVLRIDVSGNPTGEQLLSRVRRVTLEGIANGEVPFETLVRELNPERNPRSTPLFQVEFVFEPELFLELDISGLSVKGVAINNETSRHDLTLFLQHKGDSFSGYFTFKANRVARQIVAEMAERYIGIMRGLIANPAAPLSTLVPGLTGNSVCI